MAGHGKNHVIFSCWDHSPASHMPKRHLEIGDNVRHDCFLVCGWKKAPRDANFQEEPERGIRNVGPVSYDTASLFFQHGFIFLKIDCY
jgi:hypothetical protein